MKKYLLIAISLLSLTSCEYDNHPRNTSAIDEQAHTELNQRDLNQKQPAPTITWSLERDNLIKRFKLQNDRAVMFYMYIFIEGQGQPIGYYQINKVSSVNSQLTNTQQVVPFHMYGGGYTYDILPSPAEDGSYGTNGDGMFGFTPDDIYIETDMHYITSTIPLTFEKPVNCIAIITTEQARKALEISKKAMQ